MKSAYDWYCSCGERNLYRRATCQKCGKWDDLIKRKKPTNKGD